MHQASFDFVMEPLSPCHAIHPMEDAPEPAPEPPPLPIQVPAPCASRNKAVQPVRTLADALIAVDSWTHLPETARNVLKSHIRTCGLAIATAQAREAKQLRKLSRKEVRLAAMPFDIAWLNQWLHRHPWRVIGLKSNHSFMNAKSGLRYVARQLGMMETMRTPDISINGPWQPFLDVVISGYARPGINRFVAWCEKQDIRPLDVNLQTFDAYKEFVYSRLVQPNIPRLLASIKDHWKKTAMTVEGWPALDLSSADRPGTYTPPLSDYPQSFQEEVAAFARHLAGTERRGPFRRIGVRRPSRPTTITLRIRCIRMAAAALVLGGQPIGTITGLADLVTPEAAEKILLFYWNRTVEARRRRKELPSGEEHHPSAGSSSQADAIASTLLTIARHYVTVDPQVLAQLKEFATDIRRPKQNSLTRKNRERLRQFDDLRARKDLLQLPGKLMKLAMRSDMKPGDAARTARQAVMIGLLCRIPIRANNLRNLRIGHNLKFGDGTSNLANRLEFQASETKNSAELTFFIGSFLANLLQTYIIRFLPYFSEPSPDFEEQGWLFPAGSGRAGPISKSTLGKCIRDPIAEHVGADANPHLFRSLAARLRLEHSPGAIEDVRLLLGDKTMDIVVRHYAALEPVTASRRHDELIDRETARLSRSDAPSKGREKRT